MCLAVREHAGAVQPVWRSQLSHDGRAARRQGWFNRVALSGSMDLPGFAATLESSRMTDQPDLPPEEPAAEAPPPEEPAPPSPRSPAPDGRVPSRVTEAPRLTPKRPRSPVVVAQLRPPRQARPSPPPRRPSLLPWPPPLSCPSSRRPSPRPLRSPPRPRHQRPRRPRPRRPRPAGGCSGRPVGSDTGPGQEPAHRDRARPYLGFIGIHKFYLGKVAQGIIYVIFSWTLIPWLACLDRGHPLPAHEQ